MLIGRKLTPSDVTIGAFLGIMHSKRAFASALERVASIEEEIMPVTPLEVFISYAHADEARKELEKHLSLLQRSGLIKSWHDRLIPAGAEWSDEIDRALE